MRGKVFFDVRVVDGEDPLDPCGRLCVVALRIAGGHEVEQGDVVVATCGQGDLCRVCGEAGPAGAEVVGGDEVRDVDDHRGVFGIDGCVDEPLVPAAAALGWVQWWSGDEGEGGFEVVDSVRASGDTAQP